MTWIASLLFLLIPGLLIWLQDRVLIVKKLSPAFWAYFVGILMGTFLTLDNEWGNTNLEVFVALAIPTLLFSANIKQWLRLAPRSLMAYALYAAVVFVCMLLNVFLWQGSLGDAALRGAMATGVYTGGTANMAAIHVALEGPPALFAELNFTDLILSGTFLLFMLSVLPKFFRSFLPAYEQINPAPEERIGDQDQTTTIFSARTIGQIAISVLAGIVVLGTSFGLSYLIFGEGNGTFIIIALTVLALLASLIKPVREWPMSYETGDYLFLAFCVAAGAQIDLVILWENDWSQAGFMLTGFLMIVTTFVALAKVFKIDADTTLMCITSGIFGPPFIGPVANALGNREIVITGMTLGVIGLALGNFAGFFLYALLGG
ncbi:MAG: DUF819 family protein [Bacteroidia bacterium]